MFSGNFHEARVSRRCPEAAGCLTPLVETCFDVEAFEVDFQVAEVLGMATEVGKRVALLFSVEARMLSEAGTISEAGTLFAVARNPHLSAPPVSAERRNRSLRGKNFPQDNSVQLQTGKLHNYSFN